MTVVRSNVIKFEADVMAWARQVDLDIEAAVRSILFELFRRVLLRTPVDTGRLVGNWQVSRGNPATGIVETFTTRDAAVAAAAVKMKDVSFDPPEAVYWLTNNLPYAEVVEFGLYSKKSKTGKTVAGFSIQAPAGMARIAVADVEALVAFSPNVGGALLSGGSA